MPPDITLQRGWKSLGFAGPVGFLMVWAAASTQGSFDWGVFALSFGALALCWARMWVLVPVHERIQERDTAERERYFENDWYLLEAIAEFSGAEIDQLRADIEGARNNIVHSTLREKMPHWDNEDVQRFLKYFVEDLSYISSVYVDPNGKIQAFD